MALELLAGTNSFRFFNNTMKFKFVHCKHIVEPYNILFGHPDGCRTETFYLFDLACYSVFVSGCNRPLRAIGEGRDQSTIINLVRRIHKLSQPYIILGVLD